MKIIESLRNIPLELDSANRKGKIVSIIPDPRDPYLRRFRIHRTPEHDPHKQLSIIVEFTIPAKNLENITKFTEGSFVTWGLLGYLRLTSTWNNW